MTLLAAPETGSSHDCNMLMFPHNSSLDHLEWGQAAYTCLELLFC